MTVDLLFKDHQEDLHEFVINHIGMTSGESIDVCELTNLTICNLSSDFDESLIEEDLIEEDEDRVIKKRTYTQQLTSELSSKWERMGLQELQIRLLIKKFIPFLVSVIMYKLEEYQFEREEVYH